MKLSSTRRKRLLCAAVMSMGVLLAGRPALATDPAVLFGAREGVTQLTLSPDGSHIAFLAPDSGRGMALYTVAVAEGSTPRRAMSSSGNPEHIDECRWTSNSRLFCYIHVADKKANVVYGFSQLVGVDMDGKNIKILGRGGGVIDWNPGGDDKVVMISVYSDMAAAELLDTRTGKRTPVDSASYAVEFITDGNGKPRIVGFRPHRNATGQDEGERVYRFRSAQNDKWLPFAVYNAVSGTGFNPYAVDAARNVAYGFRKKGDGRLAVYTKALDVEGRETLLYGRDDVDVDGLVRIGPAQRVVGASYVTDTRHYEYFDPVVKEVMASLARKLPGQPVLYVADSSADESKLLIFAGSDIDPGRYYLFDTRARKLQVLMEVRPQLSGVTLAKVKMVSYPAADGTMIPGYLTLPTQGNARNIPAIVMPHGGPEARDQWGFDWMPQYFAARGYAVLQPNFRGSSGYGEAWLQQNGFKSWRTAIGDVLDAGRWMVAQGIADPARLAIVGWSYGGYAALQSAAIDPTLFKAVVAVAPVTDLGLLRDRYRYWSIAKITRDYIGGGSNAAEGSPIEQADRIKVPVLLVHGTLDTNVEIEHSKRMLARLNEGQHKAQLITFEGLAHSLDDSVARATLLQSSDDWLRTAFETAK